MLGPKKTSMLQGLGFCVWLTVRKSHPWWSASKRLCDETDATFCRPHVRLLEGASSPLKASHTLPPYTGIFRLSTWSNPKIKIVHVKGWPPLHRILFEGRLGENNMELEVARRFDLPFRPDDLRTASEIFQHESLEMLNPVRLIVRAKEPDPKRWKDISP